MIHENEVEITDEALVPDEYCMAEVSMLYLTWLQLRAARPDGFNTADRLSTVKREISRSAIAEALQKTCVKCGGSGLVPIVDDNAEHGNCRSCGGSGKQGVPGCRLAPRGESLIIR